MQTVLMLEDEPSLVRFAQINLEAEGYSVVTEFDAESALKRARQREPDLILLDLMLANSSGWEFLDQLRAEDRFMGTPIVILSALASKEDMSRALAAGVAEYLVKPISADELVTVVTRLLGPESNVQGEQREEWHDTGGGRR